MNKLIFSIILTIFLMSFSSATITISSLDAPTNISGTLVEGGTLFADTTLYVKVTAHSQNTIYGNTENQISSSVSLEYNFTTNSTHKSIQLTWNTVSEANYYDIYVSRSSEVYTSYDRVGSSTSHSSNTNSLLVTSEPNSAKYYPDTFPSYGSSYINYTLPGNINRNLGLIKVSLSDDLGTITIEDILDALDSAGYSDYYFYDGTNLALKANLKIELNATGSLTMTNKNIYTIMSAIRNYSPNFNLTFGAYNPTTKTTSEGCVIYLSASGNYFSYMNIYDTRFNSAERIYLSQSYGQTIGYEIYKLNEGTDEVLNSVFNGVRNSYTNWSNNKIQDPQILRTWYGIIISNTYYDTNIAPNYYPRNGMNTFYDSTMKINYPTYTLQMTGYVGNLYSTPAKFYDIDFTGAYWNNSNLEFNFASYEGTAGYEFYYSLNGDIVDTNGNYITNATVTIYNNTNDLVYNETIENGILNNAYLLTQKVVPTGNGTGSAYYNKTLSNPFRVVISKEGYANYNSTLIIYKKTNLKMVLKEDAPSLILDKIATIENFTDTEITYNITLKATNKGGKNSLNTILTDSDSLTSPYNLGTLDINTSTIRTYTKTYPRNSTTYSINLSTASIIGQDEYSNNFSTNSSESNIIIPSSSTDQQLTLVKNAYYNSENSTHVNYTLTLTVVNSGGLDLTNISLIDSDLNLNTLIDLNRTQNYSYSEFHLIEKAASNTNKLFAKTTAIANTISYESNQIKVRIPGYGGPADAIVFAPASVSSSTEFDTIITAINQNPDIGQDFTIEYWITNLEETTNYTSGQQTIYIASSRTTNLTGTLTSPSADGTYKLKAIVSWIGGTAIAYDTFSVSTSQSSTSPRRSTGGSGGVIIQEKMIQIK
jgi:hypothetical protein